MLDVEDPPRLNPMNPMSFDELYTPQSQQPPESTSEEPLVRIDGQRSELLASLPHSFMLASTPTTDSRCVHLFAFAFLDANDIFVQLPTVPIHPRVSPASPPAGKPESAASAQDVHPSDPAPAVPSQSVPSSIQDARNIVRRKLTGLCRLCQPAKPWHRKSVRKGFNFNVMVVGESGSWQVYSRQYSLQHFLYPQEERKGPSLDIIPKTVQIQAISADIEEAGVRPPLDCRRHPGFGDFVNNDESWRPIVDDIEVDMMPTSMLRTSQDTLTDEEIVSFKARILADIKHHGIQIFEGPRYELDDEETIAENNEIMSKVPFAVVGATNEIKTTDGRAVRGRQYPWGIIEVDNEEHCDFVKLRQMLIRTHMEELKENTNNALYENYRTDKLIAMGVSQDPSVFKEVNPAVKQEEERALHEQKASQDGSRDEDGLPTEGGPRRRASSSSPRRSFTPATER
ncbi:Cell division control protein 3 [Metarhizium acridum]|nr:Cell division control protein 3 [Metarhizium acridum]